MSNPSSTKSTIIFTVALAAIAIGGYVAYKKFFLPKEKKVMYLISIGATTGDFKKLMSLDDNYIDDWYKGAKKQNETFSSGGKTFVTKGGVAKQ